MNSLRQTLQLFLPVSVGIGLLAIIPQTPQLVEFEHQLFWTPNLHQKTPTFAQKEEKSRFEVTILEQTQTKELAEISSFEIDSSTEEILGASPLQPTNWAYFFSQLDPEKSELLVITSSLSWEEADEIPLLTLQHELSRFPRSILGLSAENSGEKRPLPPYLTSSVIGQYTGYPPNLPEIDTITDPPSVQPTHFGISTIRAIKSHSPFTPLLVRWGDQVLPTVELAALLAKFQINASELVIDPEGYLRLNHSGAIYLKIDDQGRTPQSWQQKMASASQLLTEKERTNSNFFFISKDAPERFKSIAGNFRELARYQQRQHSKIERWPLHLEASILIVIVLSFFTRSLWPAFLLTSSTLVISFILSKWILVTPLIALLICYPLLFPENLRSKRYSKPSPKNKPSSPKKASS